MKFGEDRKKSVLMLTADYPPLLGGVASFCSGLESGLRSLGCDVHVVTTVAGPRRDGVVRVATMFDRKIVKVVPLIAGGLQRAKQQRPDVVLAMTPGHELVAAAAMHSMTGLPYAVVAHGSDLQASLGSQVRKELTTRALAAAALVIANSTFTARLVERFSVPKSRILVLNPPTSIGDGTADGDDVDARFDLVGKRVLLTVSRLVPRKGHEYVIAVLADLATKHPDLVYVATGEGAYAAVLSDLANKHGVADRVRLVGRLSATDLRAMYGRASVYVSPSIEDGTDVEGFGIALVEAAWHGLPVIAGRSGGVEDAVLDGVTGKLVTPGNVVELSATLEHLLSNPAAREALGKAGAEHARRLTPEHQAARLLERLKVAA